jgi:uncharacterized protein
MAIDPGFRTGCKTVCLDAQGALQHHETLYPHGSEKQRAAAERRARELIETFAVEVIAVGNGTAGRETEQFIRSIVPGNDITVVLVNESGASIYSASDAARREFPDLDLTVRGAVSIGRRLMDPLAELVKIDPKSIGVGQYQHDVDPSALKQSLDDVVVSCVNRVGVGLNQASVELLTYVSGLGPHLASNILAYRNENGPFRSRTELLRVPRLGPKAFEQCAGFLRIRDGDNPLDASAVHPESYPVVHAMAADLGCPLQDILQEPTLRQKIDLRRYVSPTVGMPTLQDIFQELAKPGRDPRQGFEIFAYAPHVSAIKDLTPGMRLPGLVTNVTAFGAFVDIGVHQDGLVHISELSDRTVRNPLEVVKVHQTVMVTVLSVDLDRQRIALSLRTSRDRGRAPAIPTPDKPKTPRPDPQPTHSPFNNPFAEAFRKR